MSKNHVNILIEAKNQLKNEIYVCHAVKSACRYLFGLEYQFNNMRYISTNKDTYEILNTIDIALAQNCAAEDWLLNIHGIRLSYDEMYQYRLAWIDQMIEYWKDKK